MKYLELWSLWNKTIDLVSNLQKCLLTYKWCIFRNRCYILLEKITIISLLVKCTSQPSFITFDPLRFVCFTDCTIRCKGILALGEEDVLQLTRNKKILTKPLIKEILSQKSIECNTTNTDDLVALSEYKLICY